MARRLAILFVLVACITSPRVFAQGGGERSPLGAQQPSAAPSEKDAPKDDAASVKEPAEKTTWDGVRGKALQNAPNILAIIAIFAVLRFLISVGSKRLAALLSGGETAVPNAEWQHRAHTLVSVFENVALTVLYVGTALMILDTLGVPITALLGGVAVFGVAVGFASQSLIKDYFHGFMILLENQYGVGDVVEIAGVTGLVERITLRVTVLRNNDGAHFIPHGEITTVSNLTHQWSRAAIDIGVGYGEDVDAVMDLIQQLGAELREDPEIGPLILDDLTMLGVDELGDSAVTIKCFFKTKPIQQWTVKREMLRRIKKTFDERGIEIPFPQRTVHVRQDGANTP